jgi:glycosyltransferase involved in cell wall biosynthesis
MRAMARTGIPLLFRGDSHLLDEQAGLKSCLKGMLLKRVFSWPRAFLYVGRHNKEYYQSFGVPEEKLFFCPHSVELSRFSEPSFELEQRAVEWRRELKIPEEAIVGLFAGKFESKKNPVELMKWFLNVEDEKAVLVMAGSGEREVAVHETAANFPKRFRVLSFQNQSAMPILYRVGDFMVLPSAFGETWGLAVNEAQACGRPALVSDRVGCAPEMIIPGVTGEIFASDCGARPPRALSSASWRIGSPSGRARPSRRAARERQIEGKDAARPSLSSALNQIIRQLKLGGYSREKILTHARQFDISETETKLMNCLHSIIKE